MIELRGIAVIALPPDLWLQLGSVERLQSAIEMARQDYRDVLASAEYPDYSRLIGLAGDKHSPLEVQRIIDTDWKQYNDWLVRK